jgi:hypothetical protein
MRRQCVLVSLLLIIGGCSSSDDAQRTDAASALVIGDPTPKLASDAKSPAVAESGADESLDGENEEPTEALRAFNGRPVPRTVNTASDAASLFVEVERALRVDGEPSATYADLGHTEQLLIRSLMRNPNWIDPFREALPTEWLEVADLHLTARRELGLLHTGGGPPIEDIPAWEVIAPEPLDELISHYKTSADATGIDWPVLAGINLIETGMGRIDGLSSAGAQGPMQFLPTTWDEVSQGGDIDDPGDAIAGAARYLVQRGGLDDIREGLWGYNNSEHYVNAVLAYAELVMGDERALRGFYNWEIYVGTDAGTLWLPVGYRSETAASAADYAAENPWALTLG